MISIRKAGPGDLFSIFDILRGSGLPTEGVDEILARFLVADQEGRIVATAGIELGEECALLRSVAVVPEARGTGLGVEIVRQALRLASLSGAGTVYLLTTSARGFFERFGFRPALRAEIEAKFPDSAETSPDGACTTAEAMALRDLSSVLDPRPRR